MHRYRFLCSLFVALTLLSPVVGRAAAAPPQKAAVSVRIYDRTHKDYHVWNDDEDRAYRGYLSDQHMKYRKFSALNAKQRTAYWNWRHDHQRDDRR